MRRGAFDGGRERAELHPRAEALRHISSTIVPSSESSFLGDGGIWRQLLEGNEFTNGRGGGLAVSAPLTIPGKF